MDYKIVKYSEIGKIRSGKRLPKGYTVSEKISDNLTLINSILSLSSLTNHNLYD